MSNSIKKLYKCYIHYFYFKFQISLTKLIFKLISIKKENTDNEVMP